MKISYIANVRMPTEKAHGYQIARVCSEMKAQNMDVTLFVPTRNNNIKQDPLNYYDLKNNFLLVYIKIFDLMSYVKILGPLSSIGNGFQLALFLIFTKKIDRKNIIYSRDADIIFWFSVFGFKTFYYAHNWTRHPWIRKFLLFRVKGIVCNSIGTENTIKSNFTVPTTVIENATDKNKYLNHSKIDLRKELNLPIDKKIALYTGHLYGWKGSMVLIESAGGIDSNTIIVAIGGTKDDVEDCARIAATKGLSQKIFFLGHKEKILVPKYLAAADLLLLPNSSKTIESVEYTSPLKLFEYMAAGSPIIASDLPSIRRILSEDCAYFFKPDDSSDFVRAINLAIENDNKDKSKKCLLESEKYSWVSHVTKLRKSFEIMST